MPTILSSVHCFLLTISLGAAQAPSPEIQVFSAQITSREGKQRLQQGTWFGLVEQRGESALVSGPPQFRPAGARSPDENAIEVLLPKGSKGRVLLWIQGTGLRPGKLPTGTVRKAPERMPARMLGRFGKDHLEISSAIRKDACYSLTATVGGKVFPLLDEANTDPGNNGWHLVWIGDLNRDGRVDFVIELHRYMAVETFLLLGQPDGSFQVAANDQEDWD